MKYIKLFLMAVVVLGLSACGGGDSSSSPIKEKESAIAKIERYSNEGNINKLTIEDYRNANFHAVTNENIKEYNLLLNSLGSNDNLNKELDKLDSRLNLKPTANVQTITLDENKDINITLTGKDEHVANLAYEIVTQPTHGTLKATYATVSGKMAHFTYTPKKDYDGSDKFSFKVFDGKVYSSVVNIGITIINTTPNVPPVANAGKDKKVIVGQSITITGTATDSDGTIKSYKWKKGSTVLATTASFTYTPTVAGKDTLTFTVTDDGGASASVSMIVTVISNTPPIAKAGKDQIINEGDLITLDGSASTDSDGNIVLYVWKNGNTVLSNKKIFSINTLSVGKHTIVLTVTDDKGSASSDTIEINVKKGITNEGVSFHTSFMTNYDNAGEIFLFISAKEDTTGEITLSDNNEKIAFSVSAGDIEKIQIPNRMLLSGTEIKKKTIGIISKKDIVVIGLNKRQHTTDAFLVLPDKVLAKEYYTLNYTSVNYKNEFAIVAIEDDTFVNIELANSLGRLDINLSKGQTYQYQNYEKLTGTYIKSNKNIAVLSGTECTNIPNEQYTACDHIVEQLLPINTWENKFITVSLATRLKGDTFRILASEDNTTLSINNKTITTLDAGEYYNTILAGSNYITANNPLLVAQYSNSTAYDGVTSDPFMTLVPAINQFNTEHIINTPLGFTDYINLVVSTDSLSSIKLDGSVIDKNEFSAVAGTSYSSARIQISYGKHSLSCNKKFGMIGYGFADYDSYGYPSSLTLEKH